MQIPDLEKKSTMGLSYVSVECLPSYTVLNLFSRTSQPSRIGISFTRMEMLNEHLPETFIDIVESYLLAFQVILVVEYVVEMRWNGSIVMEVESIPRSCLKNIILVKKSWKRAFVTKYPEKKRLYFQPTQKLCKQFLRVQIFGPTYISYL